MDKKTLEELENKLGKEREEIENTLKSFAEKDENLKGDWDTVFPKMDKNPSSSSLEEEADEVEEYSSLLPLEQKLELQLKKINEALEKIEKNKYGVCENCGKEIEERRLKAYPSAKLCSKCNENKKN